MMDLSDNKVVKQLVEACIRGERSSQQKFYKAMYGKMLATCMRYAESREEAKDMLQDGFIKVFASLKEFEFKGSLEGWVRRVITNTAIDAVRKKKNFYTELEENRDYDEALDDFNDNVEYEQLVNAKVEIVMKMIQKLSPAYKAVFNLYVFEELTHQEVADRLNINIGTSKSNFSKAKMNLLKYFEEYTNKHE